MTKKRSFALGKFKGFVISVALFLLFDATVFLFNFYISFQISQDAAAVHLAGQQRMLTQRISKNLYALEYLQHDAATTEVVKNDLISSHQLFSNTLDAFDKGGAVMGAEGEMVELKAVDSKIARISIEEAKTIWLPARRLLSDVIADIDRNQLNVGILTSAIEYSRKNIPKLLTSMNALADDLERVASSKATLLRIIQSVGITLAIINFIFILFHFIRQMRVADAIAESSKRETKEILDTVQEGLFLINDEMKVGNQFSKQLGKLLGQSQQDIAGKNFTELLETIISPKDMKDARGFISLLFNPKIKEKLIQDLNPLNRVQINREDVKGHFTAHYLVFEFNRVYEGKLVTRILVTVTDITDTVLLEQQLEQEKLKNDQNMEMLTSILHTDDDILNNFIHRAYTSFDAINNSLKGRGKTETSFRQKLKDIFREVHGFKSDASMLSLHSFTEMAHDFEEQVTLLQNSKNLAGDDFLTLTVRLEKLIQKTQLIEYLISKLADISDTESQKIETIKLHKPNYFFDFIDEVSQRTGKKINFTCSGFDAQDVPVKTRSLINDVSIQLLRNAVIHGIEPPLRRKQAKKTETGHIEIRLSRSQNNLELVIEDDGQGIDFTAIRVKAIESKQWKKDEVIKWGKKQLLSLMFASGFTTAKVVDEDAGRGIGMDIVKSRVQTFGGKIQVSTQNGLFTRFIISLPSTDAEQHAA